jgi:tetratricopeptide (TPR) repeat protein
VDKSAPRTMPKPPAVLVEAARRSITALVTTLLEEETVKAIPRGVWSTKDTFRSRIVATELAAAGAADHAESRMGASRMAVPWDRVPWDERDLLAQVFLEWGLTLNHFERKQAAKTCFFLAKGAAGLETRLTGALAKRTKFQVWDAPVLVLRARCERATSEETSVSTSDEGGGVIKELTEEIGVTVRRGVFGVGEILLEDLDPGRSRLERPAMAAPGAGEGEQVSSSEIARRTTHWKAVHDGASEWASKFSAHKPAAAVAEAAVAKEEEDSNAREEATPAIGDGPLSTLHQGILLGLCLDVENSNPKDGLTRAEMMPYIRRVMDQPQNWLVHSCALLGRCDVEFADHRVMDRAVLQMQVLVDQHSDRLTALLSRRADEVHVPPQDRLRWMACLPWPSRWGLKKLLADRYLSMGVAASASTLYEELGLWGEVIDCLLVMDKLSRAKRLLSTLLREDPTPRLWTILGGISNDDAAYVRAWEESSRRYAPAMLSLGRRYFDKHFWAEALAVFLDALAISPDHSFEWACVGACAMRLHDAAVVKRDGDPSDPAVVARSTIARATDAPTTIQTKGAMVLAMGPAALLEQAARGFTESVRCDETNSDAWANLGAILARIGRWRAAVAAMERGLRGEGRRNWRAWDNLATASVHAREYSATLSAMHGVIDLHSLKMDRSCPALLEAQLGAMTSAVVESLLREGTEFDVVKRPVVTSDPGTIAEVDEPEEEDDDEEDNWGEMAEEDEEEDDADRAGESAGDPMAVKPETGRPVGVPERGFSGMGVPEVALRDAKNRPARVFTRPLNMYFERAAGAVPVTPKFWRLRASFDRARGRPDEALECKLRECRGLNRTEWERGGEANEVTLKHLVTATGELMQDFLLSEESAPASSTAPGMRDLPMLKASAARGGRRNAIMFIKGAIRRAETGNIFADHPMVNRLREMLVQLEAGMAAATIMGEPTSA